jgi:hypothetical protein
MRSLILSAVIAMVGISPAARAASDAAAFDGTWDVIAICAGTTQGAFSYTLQFPAQVASGVLHGVYGTAGKSASMTLDGTIQSDGTAKFEARGLTGDSDFAGGNVKPATPYGYDVTATFKGSRGTGAKVGGPRACNYSFTRH